MAFSIIVLVTSSSGGGDDDGVLIIVAAAVLFVIAYNDDIDVDDVDVYVDVISGFRRLFFICSGK